MPYVIGQWVRGERFYGRRALIETLLYRPRRLEWVVGMRRIGKTSLLRQIEHLAAAELALGTFPLVWDLQGVEDAAELGRSFVDAVLDAGPRMARLGIEAPGGQEVLPDGLLRLAEKLRRKGLALLLLADEAEDLAVLLGREPAVVGAWLETIAQDDSVRLVLASSVRMHALAAASEPGARLLAALGSPRLLGGLDPDEAQALVRQDHLPAPARPTLDREVVSAICERCGGHPFLLQLLARRALDLGDLEAAVEAVAADPMVGYLVATDLRLLDEEDRRLVCDPAAAEADAERLARLVALGLLRREAGGRLVAGNWFLAASFGLSPHFSPGFVASGRRCR